MSTERLFDAREFSDPNKVARDERVAVSPPTPQPIATITLGQGGWQLVAVGKQAQAHVVLNGRAATEARREMNNATTVTLCRKVAVSLTFDVGTRAGACPDCLQRGAPS